MKKYVIKVQFTVEHTWDFFEALKYVKQIVGDEGTIVSLEEMTAPSQYVPHDPQGGRNSACCVDSN